MNVLVLTNHLAFFGGSETVAMEVASTFLKLDCNIHISSAYIEDPVRSYMNQIGYEYSLIHECPDIGNFDIIWSQHQLLPYLIARSGIDSLKRPFIINASLSPFEPLEMPGAIADIADMIVANSPETADRLKELGIDEKKIRVFYNAAPDEYNSGSANSPHLGRILLISNHAPNEITLAADVLRARGIAVEHVGLPVNQKKVTPDMIAYYDAIISIGKSVQYSLLSEKPVYVYDRFGGPGWLTVSNIADAEKFNFSGRCCRRKLSPEEIEEEIVDGYAEAARSAQHLKQIHADKYILKNYLKDIIKRVRERGEKTPASKKIERIVYREGLLSEQSIHLYQTVHQQSDDLSRQIALITQKNSQIETLQADFSRISERTAQLEADHAELLHARAREAELLHARAREAEILHTEIETKNSQLAQMQSSLSWRITKPLRGLKTRLRRYLT